MDNNTEKILTELSKRIKAEQDRADAERETAAQTRRLAEAARRQEANYREVLQRYANLGEQISGLLPLVRQALQLVDADREWREDLADEISSILHLVRLLIGLELAEDEQKEKAVREIKKFPEIDGLRRRLARHRRNLQILLDQEASHGGYPPLTILNEIDAVRAKIAQLELKLDELGE